MSHPDPRPRKVSVFVMTLALLTFLCVVLAILIGIPLLLLGREARPLIMIFLGIFAAGAIVGGPKLLIDLAWSKGGKLFAVATVIHAICLIVALPMGVYVLISGASHLWHESPAAAVVWVGCSAYVGYYYFARSERPRNPPG